MKKRYDDGYVLVYVVVVIVILSILVPAACANSLRNLKAQQASVERMQQLYEAEGQIERFVAEMQSETVVGLSHDGYDTSEKAEKAAKDAFKEAVIGIPNTVVDNPTAFDPRWKGDQNNQCEIPVTSKAEKIKITARINVTLGIETEEYKAEVQAENGETKEEPRYSYKITSCTITYDSYDISASTETKNTGEGASGQS